MTSSRKPRTRRAAPARTATPIADQAATSLRDLWLAGLGAVVLTGETAAGAVDALVARGRKREPRIAAAAEQVAREARGLVEELASTAARRSKQAIDETLERLGQKPAPRQKNILHRLGDLAEALL